MISDAYDLQRGVWVITSRGVLDGAFVLIDECLNGKVGVVQHAKFGVVVFQVGRQNVRIGCIKMIQDGAGGGGAVAHVAVAEKTGGNFVDGGDEHLSKGLVGAIVLVEDCDGDVIGVSKVGDMGNRHDIWDGGIGSKVNRRDEIRGR